MPSLLPDLTPVTTQFDRAVEAEGLHQPLPHIVPVTERDLAHLPAPVARYLRRAGVVGRPRVHNFVVEMDAELSRGPGQPWMHTPVLQVSFVDHPTRLFLLRTRMHGLPVSGLHSYSDEGASMHIRLLSLLHLVDASGDAFARAETVTVLNDFCIMAPAVLIDERFVWHPINAHEARVTFHNGARVISASLRFNDDGDLIDFSSDDRHALPGDGDVWTTPLRAYHEFGVARLASEGDAVWHYTDKPAWTYGKFHIRSVRYNVPVQDLPHAKTLAEGHATA
jgi:hypothetical protein